MNTNPHESPERGCVRRTSRSNEQTNGASNSSPGSFVRAAAGTSSTAALRVTRRDFARYGAFAAVSAVAAHLVARRLRETCINDGVCRGCMQFSDCGLPQALSAKSVLKGGVS